VKEEVLTRFGELGFHVAGGRLLLSPGLIPPDEVLPTEPVPTEPIRAVLTVCAVPMTIEAGREDAVVVERADGTSETIAGLELDAVRSRDLFARTATIVRVRWLVGEDTMATWRRRSATPRT
jgi:hypothetical protein